MLSTSQLFEPFDCCLVNFPVMSCGVAHPNWFTACMSTRRTDAFSPWLLFRMFVYLWCWPDQLSSHPVCVSACLNCDYSICLIDDISQQSNPSETVEVTRWQVIWCHLHYIICFAAIRLQLMAQTVSSSGYFSSLFFFFAWLDAPILKVIQVKYFW